MFKKNAKHRANDVSNDVHRPPLVTILISKPSCRKAANELYIADLMTSFESIFEYSNMRITVFISIENQKKCKHGRQNKTLPKALRTQALTALTSILVW